MKLLRKTKCREWFILKNNLFLFYKPGDPTTTPMCKHHLRFRILAKYVYQYLGSSVIIFKYHTHCYTSKFRHLLHKMTFAAAKCNHSFLPIHHVTFPADFIIELCYYLPIYTPSAEKIKPKQCFDVSSAIPLGYLKFSHAPYFKL